jgi:hypothetical protein
VGFSVAQAILFTLRIERPVRQVTTIFIHNAWLTLRIRSFQ